MLTINKHIILILVSIPAFWSFAFGEESREPNFTDFYQTLEKGTDGQAVLVGQKIFEHIERKYRDDAGFGALRSKMTAADFLANQMITQLNKTTSRQMAAVARELFEDKTNAKNRDLLSVAPAKSFYENSQQIFSKPISISELKDEEKKFLAGFYDLKLRILTGAIAKAGKALAIAEPNFKGTYNYVLVLPLLHTSETRPINMNVLPKWMRTSDQLGVFSDSALLHYGFAYHAQAFAKQAAELDKKEFSQENFYRVASKKSAKQLPHVAVDCLQRAINIVDVNKIDERINLQFDIIQIWLDSEDFVLAASEAKKVADSFPNHKKCGDVIWLYFYAMSRANNVETILANIDAAISDIRCSAYKARLMYIKWWALRRQKEQTAQIASLEHQLLTEYSNDEIVAPIMLSRATDLLAGQDYTEASVLLEQVQEKFPSTKAAEQAKKIVEKLKLVQSSREEKK